MSLSDEGLAGDPYEVQFTMSNSGKTIEGKVIQKDDSHLLVQIPVAQFDDRSQLDKILSEGEVKVVSVWTRISDKVTQQLPAEGMPLIAWVRVKLSDGKFVIKKDESLLVAKTALFSLGVVAAVSITRRAVQHYKSR